jgi:hypothetical protein
VIGKLLEMSNLLPGALDQISASTQRAFDQLDPVEDDGGDPVQRILAARQYLERAGEIAAQLGAALELAHAALAHQGYRQPESKFEAMDRGGNVRRATGKGPLSFDPVESSVSSSEILDQDREDRI